MKRVFGIAIVLAGFFVSTCQQGKSVKDNEKIYQTKHVIIVVIDGPRYSETWGNPTYEYIPYRSALLNEGVLVEQFFNQGATLTNPGHTAITTGNYDNVANNGTQLPHNPTLFQCYRKYRKTPAEETAVVASKDKLHILTNSTAIGYFNRYPSYFDCGVNGNGTGGYRADSITHAHVFQVLQQQHPHLMLINYKDPDVFGHQAKYNSYLKAIRVTDKYVAEIWAYIQSDPDYKDKTTLIVTNDHGRHLDGISNGYVSHGDNCEGCRRIEFFALSPDFKKGVVVQTSYEQIDVTATVAELLHIPMPYCKGKVMAQLFK